MGLALLSIIIAFMGAALIGIPLAIIFLVIKGKYKKAWDLLTMNNTIIHPVLADKSPKSPEIK